MNTIQISKDFKKSITKVTIAIILFFIAYLMLVIISAALLAASIYISAYIISAHISFLTVAAVGGLIGLGIMFFIFSIKFIFTKHTDSNQYRVEVFEKDYPELFTLIAEVSGLVGTQFPRKVFFRHDVNASVFYNSSFWSLFFPVKKNLDIGLGLINSVNQAELKAVLAHEFGHFSQRSMKLGSYVYTLNNVIYNLVYDYDRWDRTLERWANAGGIFGFFALITFKMVEAVRFVLRKAYNLINIPYLSLSREMEFHADAIASNVVGNENMIAALRRIEYCDIAFMNTLDSLNELARNEKLSKNIYLDHKYEIQRLSEYFNLNTENDLPLISDKDLDVNTRKSRVIYEDQWASHPSREDREKRILNIPSQKTDHSNDECWKIINNCKITQESLSKNYYSIEYGDLTNYNFVTNTEYINFKQNEQAKYKVDNFFNGFYSNRFITNIELDSIPEYNIDSNYITALKDIYSKKTKLKFEKLQYDNEDLQTLLLIKQKNINTKYFEFDHEKYHRREIGPVIKKLEDEINSLRDDVKEIEKKSIIINLALAEKISPQNRETLLNKYKDLFYSQGVAVKHQELLNHISLYQYTIYNKTTWKEDELKQFNRDVSSFEQEYKKYLQEINFEVFAGLQQDHKDKVVAFIAGKKTYTRIATFDVQGFNDFLGIIYENHTLINESINQHIKELADIQLNNYNELKLETTSLENLRS